MNSAYWRFFSSSRIQINLDIWSRSITRGSISFYSCCISLCWGGLDLHLSDLHLSSYKESNPLKILSNLFFFHFLSPSLLEFSSYLELSMDRERDISFIPMPDSAQCSQLARFSALRHKTKSSLKSSLNVWLPQIEPQVSLELRARCIYVASRFPMVT